MTEAATKPCKHRWRMKVELFLDIPSEMAHQINKRTLRSRRIRVDGANWPKAYTYCEKCGVREGAQ